MDAIGSGLEGIIVHGDETKIIGNVINQVQYLFLLGEFELIANVEILGDSVPC